jgi:hypothetical protein
MPSPRALILTLSATVATLAPAVPAGGVTARATVLRLDGIGPLKLGMTRTAAVATGWLAHGGSGCPLGGKPYPVTFKLDGPHAPRRLRGSVEFVGGKLHDISITAGARTATGVVPGTTTVARMLSAYRRAGYSASSRYDSTFSGTFVTVTRRGRTVLEGFASGRVVGTLAIPALATCE